MPRSYATVTGSKQTQRSCRASGVELRTVALIGRPLFHPFDHQTPSGASVLPCIRLQTGDLLLFVASEGRFNASSPGFFLFFSSKLAGVRVSPLHI